MYEHELMMVLNEVADWTYVESVMNHGEQITDEDIDEIYNEYGSDCG